MILQGSFETSWIQKISKAVGKRGDPKLVEKIIYAFALLEQLKLSGLDMVFKGGTSVFLMSDPPNRFSIDVDIIVSEVPEKLPAIFDNVMKSGLFIRWQEDNDRKMAANAPVSHYKFFYKSIAGSHFGDEPILLDVLFTSTHVYKKTNPIPLKHSWLLTSEPYEMITVPSFESLTGDKLTAFAPNTTGILYTKNRPVEIIKQLFDIAFLFDRASDFSEIRESFLNVVAEEIKYRNLAISHLEVLQDAFYSAFLITQRDLTSTNFNFLQKGITNIINFIIATFRVEEAIVCSSKVAYLSQIIRQNITTDVARFKSPEELTAITIEQKEFSKLNRLKKTLPEAFFYWYHAINLFVQNSPNNNTGLMKEDTEITKHIDDFLSQADNIHFKFWAIVGNDTGHTKKIITYLQKKGWTSVDVGKDIINLPGVDLKNNEPIIDIGEKIKEWMSALPDKLILTNASILYEKKFNKITPIGAFKYNVSRTKHCVLLLENETLVSNRLYYGKVGSDSYADREINDIVLSKVEEVAEVYTPLSKETKKEVVGKISDDGIGKLFNYTPIKDVIDINLDLRDDISKQNLISTFIVSESLEKQIVEFYENLENPSHKAAKIIGNYGSGKSHLIAFLITSITNPELRQYIKNKKVKEAAEKCVRNFFVVQFELNQGDADLATWFYSQLQKQLKSKYDIFIPLFDEKKHFDQQKEFIIDIVNKVKEKDKTAGLLVVMDEVSDFLYQKPIYLIKRDLQFLRVVAQVCQSADIKLVTSMQEDIYTGARFKEIAAEESRISERFQSIYIHKEDVKNIIAQRIVPKNSNQKIEIEAKLKPFAAKIEDVANNMEDFVNLYPFTPELIDLFQQLPFFEKRGVIQFAQKELKYVLNEKFPYFFTFNCIYDLIEANPNVRNLKDVYTLIKVVNVVKEKIRIAIPQKNQVDALKIVKALAVYSLWTEKKSGATAKELVDNLLIIPDNKVLSATDYLSKIIQDIRSATDGFYIKVKKDEKTGNDYFLFDPAIDGDTPEERIDKEISTISDDLVEREFFKQIQDNLELQSFENLPEIFDDECSWQSVKSFRKGYILFYKKGIDFSGIQQRDYAIAFVSPFLKEAKPNSFDNLLSIHVPLDDITAIEHLKRIAAIRQLLNKGIMKPQMQQKYSEAIDGTFKSGVREMGIRYRLARWVYAKAACELNHNKVSIQSVLSKEINNLPEIIDEVKKKLFDKCFNDKYPDHPKYSMQLSSNNISSTLSAIANEIVGGDFSSLTLSNKEFLKSIHLLNSSNDPEFTDSFFAQSILNTITSKGAKLTEIKSELVNVFANIPHGLEPEIVHLYIVYLTVLGKISLKAIGGDTIDISNIVDKFKNLSQFETIKYAAKQEDLPYDFAERLLNKLSCEGIKMRLESTRNEAFRKYKEKVQEIIEKEKSVILQIKFFESKSVVYLNIDQVKEAFEKTKVIDWSILNIANHASFNTISHLNSNLTEIGNALSDLYSISDALKFYFDTVADGIDYMKQANEIIASNGKFVTDETVIKKLIEIYNDTLAITSDYSRFGNLAERHPLSGKIKAFIGSYIKDFYYPAHEQTVGKKINWKVLQEVSKHSLYDKIMLLMELECLVVGKFRSKLTLWQTLLSWRCYELDSEKLNKTPFCTLCNFMKIEGRDYSQIKFEIKNLDKTIENIYAEYVENAITEISNNIKNIDINDIPANHKKLIKTISDSKKLPEKLDRALIASINQLFKNFKIVELSGDHVLSTLFKKDQLLTMDQLRKGFMELENEIKKGSKDDEIRIKLS